MYCGDETGAFVGDIGTHTSRFGYGGEDAPKIVIPSCSYERNDMPVSLLRPPTDDIVPIFHQPSTATTNNNTVHPDTYLNDGIIENWDAWESKWRYAFHTLRVRDGLKHSRGGGSIRNSSSSSGVSSSTVGGGGGDGGGEGKCTHPLLAVDCGYTAYSTNDSHNNNNNNNDTSPPSSSSLEEEEENGGFGTHHLTSTSRRQRTKITEILFESLDAPAVFIAPSPMLAAFCHGRQTALVVDVGGGGTRVTPIVDGLVLGCAQRRSGRGGEWISEVARHVLREEFGLKEGGLKGRYQVLEERRRRRHSHNHPQKEEKEQEKVDLAKKIPLFHQWAVRDVMYEMKTWERVRLEPYRIDTSVPFVVSSSKKVEQDSNNGGDAMDITKEDASSSNEEEEESDEDGSGGGAAKVFELPDGTKIDLVKGKAGKDLCRLPELFFTDDIPYCTISQKTPPPSTTSSSITNQTLSSLPIHKLAHSSLNAIGDGDARKELCGNMILTGASSLYPNMEQRLSAEMANVAPSTYKCRIIASRNSMERRYAAWIGGSVLTSLGSFQQLWLSRAEYEEYGVMLGVQRFP